MSEYLQELQQLAEGYRAITEIERLRAENAELRAMNKAFRAYAIELNMSGGASLFGNVEVARAHAEAVVNSFEDAFNAGRAKVTP